MIGDAEQNATTMYICIRLGIETPLKDVIKTNPMIDDVSFLCVYELDTNYIVSIFNVFQVNEQTTCES